MTMRKKLQEKVKEFSNLLPFMENRDKGDFEQLIGQAVTIRDFGFLSDNGDKEYVCIILDEDKEKFYFGGQVLTDNMKELEEEGYKEEIQNEGLPVKFDKKISKNKRQYTTVQFFPKVD